MSAGKFLNLYVYSDSLAFRRHGQSHDLSFTYPFVLKALIEKKLDMRTNLLLRGGGGMHIGEIRETVVRDSGYFGGDDQVLNIAILQFGIVDCAPRPVTYLLAPILRGLPVIGPRILANLVKHRPGLQTLCSYTTTPRTRFKNEYARILRTCHGVKIRPVAVGLPLPPLSMEQRSPGFRRSANIYNQIIRDVVPDSFCDIEQCMTETLRGSLLQADGHHLTEDGHRYYAEKLFASIQKLL